MNLKTTIRITDGHGWTRIFFGATRPTQEILSVFIRVHPWLVFSLALALAPVVCAQQTPHVAYVYPAGGQVGTTFQIVVGGQFLSGITNFEVILDGGLASVKIIGYNRQLKPDEQQALKDELTKFQNKQKTGARLTASEVATVNEIKQTLTQFGRRPANPAIGEFMTLQLALATNAAPGDHEIRVRTPGGLSNPLKFCVGVLPEATKPDWKAVPKERGSLDPAMPLPVDAAVKLPATINGQIAPGGVDRYRFTARKGQQLVISAGARALIPYLADAVPGWFEATLTIYNARGNTLAYDERYHFRPDPVVHFEVPQDGDYIVEIHDSIFRGREDFVYRLTIGELPFVTGIFPLGGRLGEKTTVTLTGWNLPEKSLLHDNSVEGITSLKGKFFNAVSYAVDDLPEISAGESNHSTETAQAVSLPVIINGRVGKPGEKEIFKFEGHAGQPIVAEVFARRLDSPLDSFLRLTDASGKQLAFNDDFEDKGSGLNTFHADSYLTATLPADGTYYLQIFDTEGQGGPEFAYRLRVSEPRPDFALRIVPSSVSLRTSMSAPLTVYALRRDGFTNAIDLKLKNAPAGFSLSGARVLTNQDKVQFTLKAPPDPSENPVSLSIEGVALVAGKSVTNAAVPAEDMMQAFAYRHLVPSKELAVVVNGQPRLFARDAFKIISATPVKIPAGGTVRVQVSTPSAAFAGRYDLELAGGAPDGVTIQNVAAAGNGVEIELSCDKAKSKPGLLGNLIVNILNKVQPAAQPAPKPGNPRRNPVGTFPAIPFQIVGGE